MTEVTKLDIQGQVYLLKPLTLDQAEESFLDQTKPARIQNRTAVAMCLNNGDDGSRSIEDIGKFPFSHWQELFTKVLEINGFKSEAENLRKLKGPE